MSCSALHCLSRTTKGGVKNPELSFHTFPKYPEIRSMWIKAIRRTDWEPQKYDRLCSKHFEPSCFISGLKVKKLKTDAIPTIFPGHPKYYQPVAKKSRHVQRLDSFDKPATSATSLDFKVFSSSKVDPIFDEATLNFLKTIEKLKSTSFRRLTTIKFLRKSRQRALKKIVSLENKIKNLEKQLVSKTQYIFYLKKKEMRIKLNKIKPKPR